MTTPTKAAMRAAEAIIEDHTDENAGPCEYAWSEIEVATIIDREFAELVAALRACDKLIRYLAPDSPCVEIARAALARVDGTEPVR